MQKQITQFKSVINDIENIFHFDASCPIEIAKLALMDCLKWIGQIEDAQKAQLAQKEAEEKAKADAEAVAIAPVEQTPEPAV